MRTQLGDLLMKLDSSRHADMRVEAAELKGLRLADNHATLLELCDVGDVRPDTPCRVEKSGMAYAVFQLGEAYYVTQDACTHGPGSLSEGYVESGEVECPFHQGRFCIRTGKPTSAPCTVPLKIWEVVVRAGRICIFNEEPEVHPKPSEANA